MHSQKSGSPFLYHHGIFLEQFWWFVCLIWLQTIFKQAEHKKKSIPSFLPVIQLLSCRCYTEFCAAAGKDLEAPGEKDSIVGVKNGF